MSLPQENCGSQTTFLPIRVRCHGDESVHARDSIYAPPARGAGAELTLKGRVWDTAASSLGLGEGEMENCQQERPPPLTESHLGAIATDTGSSGAG